MQTYLEELDERNDHIHAALEKDANGRFARYAVCFRSSINALKKCGVHWYSVDGCATTHPIAKAMQLRVLVGRTSENTSIVLAWSFEKSKSPDSYAWLAQQCRAAGFHELMEQTQSKGYTPVLFTDGSREALQFSRLFPGLHHAQCAKHLAKSIQRTLRALRRRGKSVPACTDESLIGVCQALTCKSFHDKLAGLKTTNAEAACAYWTTQSQPFQCIT